MAKRKKSKLTPLTIATRNQKWREVRDVFNKLRKKYQLEVVYTFFRQHYHIQPSTVDHIICHIDREPVDATTSSLVYNTVMQDTFYL